MKINRRRLATNLLNVVAFAGATLLVWLYLVHGLQWVYFGVLSYYLDGEVSSIPIFVMSLRYYMQASGLAFYLAVIVRLLRPIRRLLKMIRHYTYPPYRTANPRKWPPLVTQLKFQTGERYSLKLALGMLVGTLLYLVVIVRTGYFQAPLYGESIIQKLGKGQISTLTAVLSYLFSIPFGQIEEQFIDGLNQYAIAANLLFLWMPTVFLAIGMLNLISVLHNKTRRLLYTLIIKYLSQNTPL